MEVQEARLLESPEASTLPSARSGPVDRVEDVQGVQESFLGNFPLRRPASNQAPRLILAALLSFAVALSIAFLLQKCFHGQRKGVAEENSVSFLRVRESARRLSDGDPRHCYPKSKASDVVIGQQATPKDGGHEGDAQAAGGESGSPRVADQPLGGSASSTYAALGSSASTRTAQISEFRGTFLSGLRRTLGRFLRVFGAVHRQARVNLQEPTPSTEPVLVGLRKKGSNGGYQDDGNVGGDQQKTVTGAASAFDSSGKGTKGQKQGKEKKTTGHTGSRSRNTASGRKALGKKAGRRMARLLAQAGESGPDVSGDLETPETAQHQELRNEGTRFPLSVGEAEETEANASEGPEGSEGSDTEELDLIDFFVKGHSAEFVKLAKLRRNMEVWGQVGDEAERVTDVSGDLETPQTSQHQEPRSEETSSSLSVGGAEETEASASEDSEGLEGSEGSDTEELDLIGPTEPLSEFLAKGHSAEFVKLAKLRRKMKIWRQVGEEAERVMQLIESTYGKGEFSFRWWIDEPEDDDVFD
ncbi:hypothetical protein Esti_002961 [Eimeria stiedai]